MTSLDNLEKQLAFLKKSMEKLDPPKVEEAQEKTRDVNAISIYGFQDDGITPNVSPLTGNETTDQITDKILGIIGTENFAESYSIQDYINNMHSEHDAALLAATASAAPPGVSQGVPQAVYEQAIQDHKANLQDIYTALAALTAPPAPPAPPALAGSTDGPVDTDGTGFVAGPDTATN